MRDVLRRHQFGVALAVACLGAAVAAPIATAQESPAASGSTSACPANAGPATPADPAAPVVTLQFWHRGNPSPDAIACWNELNPNIQVVPTRIPDSERVTKLAASVQAGNPPDIVDADVIDGPFFGLTGVVQEITDRVNALP